jgi:NagD protein
MKSINEVETFLLDMDGTVYLGNELIDGSKEFIELMKEQNKKCIFLTNNSSKSKSIYVEKLNKLDIKVTEDDIFTSGEATTIYVNSLKPKAKIFLLGTKALEDEFISSGFELIKERDQEIDYVVLGFDTTLTYEKLWIACDYIREGVGYIATHPDFNCPLADGKFMPDAGAMIEFIYASTNKRPYVVGKPNSFIIESICKKYNLAKESLAMVGDRLYTDIKTGVNANITSVLVYSGETTVKDYLESDIKAGFTYPSLKEMKEELER